MPLLLTKLFIPKTTDQHIKREKLLNKLIAGYYAGNQLTLACAPAGYGKSTAVLEFLKTIDVDSAWISLDEGDNDTQRFFAYMVAALRKANVNIDHDIETHFSDIGLIETILTMLVNCIAVCEEKKILVLDDYHIIRTNTINDILKFLLDHQPPNLHLVIISREDPQLPLARLRMKGKLTELRMDDLQFSYEEAAELFEKSTDIKLSNEAITKLTSRTEGWIAGLKLISLLLKNCTQDRVDEYIEKFDGTNSYIIDYLVEEVLEHQERDVSDFLCKTSILERMNDKLCNELTGRSDSKEILQSIDKANLFLIPLDDKREWYRYHHLFADSLKTRLSEDTQRELNRKAAIWMSSNNFPYEAVGYAFKSKDMSLAIRMAEGTVTEAFRNSELNSLSRWMDMLPEDMVKESDMLSARKAIASFVRDQVNEAIKQMITLDKEFEQNASLHNKGLLFYIKAMLTTLAGQDAEQYAKEALKFLQPWDPIARISALYTLGRAQYSKGQVSEAACSFKSAYEEGLKIGHQFITTLALMNFGYCLHVTGKSKEALVICEQYIDEMKRQFPKLPPFMGMFYVTMAEFYNNIDIEKAQLFKEEGIALSKNISYDMEASFNGFNPPIAIKEATEKTNLCICGEKLSERETEILTLLGKGCSNREIAETLFVTINTIQWHISHIYGKLGVKSRTQAILKAKEFGIL